jgi:hypothetical protein
VTAAAAVLIALLSIFIAALFFASSLCVQLTMATKRTKSVVMKCQQRSKFNYAQLGTCKLFYCDLLPSVRHLELHLNIITSI